MNSIKFLLAVLFFVVAASPLNAQLFGQYGILDLTANGGINPNTGVAWQLGDQYRLAFHTVGATGNFNGVSNDPEDYNNYVTAEANANPALVGSLWKAMVTVNLDSSTTQLLSPKSHVKDNTGTADLTGGSGIGGAGVPVYAMDGRTAIARNNADIWNGWSNPFDGDSVIRVVASQNVHYSPFLDQFGNQTVTPDDVHGIDVATGADRNGNHVNALGDTTDNTTFNRGNSNANNVSRIWNRFTDATTTARSFYALSEILMVGDGSPPPQLSLQVNTATGDIMLIGDEEDPQTMRYYQITSDGNSLDETGWDSLADQDYEGNGPADGSGNGWEEAGGARPGVLAEGYLLGESTIAVEEIIQLGRAYNPSVDARDLVFTYLNERSFNVEGVVEYVSILYGDYNNDNVVDLADYTVWRNNLGAAADSLPNDGDGGVIGMAQYETWKANFGLSINAASASTVPEPSALGLLCAMTLGCGLFRSRHLRYLTGSYDQ